LANSHALISSTMVSVGFLIAAAASFISAYHPAYAFQQSVGISLVNNGRTAALSHTKSMTKLSSSTTANNNDSLSPTTSKSYLYNPTERDEHYNGNIAQYLLDLNDEGATFNFCGGMMFQLVLTDKLKSHLQSVAANDNEQQPIIYKEQLMNRIPNYKKSSFADNISIFHGRELRGIPSANGGMNFCLQLSYADPNGVLDESESPPALGGTGTWTGKSLDPQGWSTQEINTYDGWRQDTYRKWRTAELYESEGYTTFTNDFNGADKGYGLNHRFYLHYDNSNRMWLSAEDGCEGTPDEGKSLIGKLGGMLFGK